MEMGFWAVLAALGIALHFLKKVMEARNTTKTVNLKGYWKDNPYASAISILGTAVGFIIFWRLGYMNDVVAFGTGYMGNSLADMFGKRAEALIDKVPLDG